MTSQSGGAPGASGARAIGRRLAPWLAVGALLLVGPLLLLAPNVFGGRSLVPYDALVRDPVYRQALQQAGVTQPQNGLLSDLVYQNDPWKRFAVEALHAGQVPLWNARLFGGIPFLAAGQHSLLYPSMLLFLALGTDRAFTWSALAAFWLAGLTAYALGRSMGLGRLASLLLGGAWSINLVMVTNVVFPQVQGVLVWTPLVLAGIETVARDASPGRGRRLLPHGRAVIGLLAVAVALALSALAGHVEMLYYALLFAAAFALFRLGQAWRAGGRSQAVRAGAWLVAFAALGLGLAAAQLVPMAELARVNWRSGSESYEAVRGYAFGLRQALTFVLPDAYGNPSHHAVYDIVAAQRTALDGDGMWGTAWGTKNYVEAAAYVGVLPLLLATVGLLWSRRRGLAWFLGGFGALALSFAFGLPTYRLLFLALPGFDQLHTPFRWVFPFALSVVMLAGLGAERLLEADVPRWLGGLGLALTGLGLAALGGLAAVYRAPAAWTSAVEQAFRAASGAMDAALPRFGSVTALASYEYWNVAHLAAFVALSGLAVTLLVAWRQAPYRRLAGVLALAVIVADLGLVGYRFNPAVDPGLGDVRPPVLAWLADAAKAKWGRVVGFGEDKVLWPNTAMRGPASDLRGYDSMIPRWVVETYNAIDTGSASLEPGAPRHAMLDYNRFGNLTRPESLEHPALSALGARYVVTTDTLHSGHLTLVQSGDVNVYENDLALPRAWVVNQVEVIRDRPQLYDALGTFDPTATVLLQEAPEAALWQEIPAGRSIARPTTRVRSDLETANSLEIEVVGAPSGGMLVVSDNWYPGWQAEVQPAGATTATQVPVFQANGSMRAVPVPPGLSTVRMKFSPMSLKVGLYVSFLAAVVLLLCVAYALWDRLALRTAGDRARLVAVNSAGPMAASLVNKVVDFVFAMLMLRVLGSENAGNYYFAIAVIGFAEIFANFGLNLWTTREVAKEPGRAGEVLVGTSLLRVVFWFLTIPMLAAYLALERASGAPVGRETALALSLLGISLLPGGINTALSSIFQGLERMLVPAGVSIVSTLVKVSLGALVLLAGFGYVGLAGVSIVTNLVTLAVLAALLWRAGVRPVAPGPDLHLAGVIWASWPLMLNHLLVTLFFRVDVVLLRQMKGAVVVGWYSTAYKWVDALLIIPPAVTMAVFPMLSRHAAGNVDALRRTYALALRWLITLALPMAAVTTFSAELLVRVLGGSEYLPHGAIALQIMIWFLPFSFANGLTQYVLVALDRQRWITVSFLIAATFNVVANLLVIPRYSYAGSAAVTILSELVLMVPFLWGLRDIGAPPILVLAWRPALATSLMAVVMAALATAGAPFGAVLLAGVTCFVVALLALGGITQEDRALLARLVRPPAPALPAGVDPAVPG